MNFEHCPTQEQLRCFARGSLPSALGDAIADHAESCAECDRALELLDNVGNGEFFRLCTGVDSESQLELSNLQRTVSRIQSLHCESQDLSHSRIGEFELLERLGAGATGVVYRARDVRDHRAVALKVLAEPYSSTAYERFRREANIATGLRHPNIVATFELNEGNDCRFLVMELLDGMSLSTLFDHLDSINTADACEIVRQVANGLQHIHENHIVHRDLKPSNIMLTTNGEVKILDLGLALAVDAPSSSAKELTNNGQVLGTIEYMAPEQLFDSHRVDSRADLYAVGATLYKLIVGQTPFPTMNYTSTLQNVLAIASHEPDAIDTHSADVRPELARLLDLLLAKDPEGRLDSSAKLAREIEPFCAGADLCELFKRAKSAVVGGIETTGCRLPKPAQILPSEPEFDTERSWWQRPAVVLGCLLMLSVFASVSALVFFLGAHYGRVEFLVSDEDVGAVEISVKQESEVVRVLNEESGWQLRLKEGSYQLELKDNSDEHQLSDTRIRVIREQLLTVQVLRKNEQQGVATTETAKQSELSSGLLVFEFVPPAQKGFVTPKQLGPIVQTKQTRFFAPWRYTSDFNAAAVGYLKIERQGRYRFKTYNHYDRNALYVDGRLVCPYRGSTRGGTDPKGQESIDLQPGLVPFLVVGYAGGRGTVKVTWQPPGQQDFSFIPIDAFYFNPTERAIPDSHCE